MKVIAINGSSRKKWNTALLLESALNGAASESTVVTDTYQFDDYSKYETSAFDADEKARRRVEVFPADCQKAFEMGVHFAK